MRLIEQILAVMAPHECVGCAAEGGLLCGTCRQQLPPSPRECYGCRRPDRQSLTCPACSRLSALIRVCAATIYRGEARTLIWRLKSTGARSAAVTMARSMADLVLDSQGYILVPLPTATGRIRRRGFDHSRLLTRELSRLTGLARADCLVRRGQTHQVGADKALRISQLAGAYRINNAKLVRGADIMLVDDVMTTGASLETAARLLKAAGAARVEAVVFARPALKKSPPHGELC